MRGTVNTYRRETPNVSSTLMKINLLGEELLAAVRAPRHIWFDSTE
jgi:hypothetical protein